MVTINNMLVDSFAAEVLKHFVDAVNTVEDGLEEQQKKHNTIIRLWRCRDWAQEASSFHSSHKHKALLPLWSSDIREMIRLKFSFKYH